jgi:hypothetical protein
MNCAIDLSKDNASDTGNYECNAMTFYVFDPDTMPVYNASVMLTISNVFWISTNRSGRKENETYSGYDGLVGFDICAESNWDARPFNLVIEISHSKFTTAILNVTKANYAAIDSVFLSPKN